MADLILACPREGHAPLAAERLRRAALRLAPPEVPPREPLLLESDGVVAVAANPTAEGVFLRGGPRGEEESGAAATGGGLCVGGLFGTPGAWWQVGAEAPEGTYALIRWDAGAVELVSDVCASRTLWYALTEDALLASTSQRALVMLLGSFALEPEATACFLSSGTLGPTVSWDARLRRLPPDARLTLDRAAWRITLREAPFALSQAAADPQADVARLRDAVAATCGSLNLDLERWVLPLSGGRDSRTLLAFLVANGLRPRCVTWTTRKSLRNPFSDASIARVLARRFHVEHELLFLDQGDADPETVIGRFVAANEGRNDEIAGYLDGFALWRDLAAAGVQGVIRGDQSSGIGSRPMQPESGRRQVGGVTPADYPEDHPLRKLELASQHWPARLRNGPREDLNDYRLRLSQDGYLPFILAGLNEPKARYLEIVNPHLSRQVIGTVRSLAPESRYRAAAYHRITDGLARAVPYARFSSTQSASDLLHRPDMHELIVRELVSPAVEQVLGADGALQVLTAMSAAAGERPRARARLKEVVKQASDVLPTNLANRLAPAWKGPETLPPAKLGFRALLASRTIALFQEDGGRAQRMADFILACTRTGHPGIAAECLRRAALRLAPPEMPLREPLFVTATGIAAAVANPTAEGVFLRRGPRGEEESGAAPAGAICVGGLFGAPGAWWQVGAQAPEGTYALARWDEGVVELVSDICASRTLWYALTEDAFLASTSQRALVMLLGDFQLEPEATACFLSSGTLGPTVSWDARLRRLPPDARAVLDRGAWRITLHKAPFELNPTAGHAEDHVARLRAAIATTCGALNCDMDQWVLPLSGGRDSRALLAFLVANGLRPRCVTWTTRASLRKPLSDVSIARRLARRYHVEHELLLLDDKDADADTIVARFVAANEGRNDEIAGYMDGFALWAQLATNGVSGVLRGDEAYGPRRRAPAPEDGRMGLGGATAGDYPAGHVIHRLDLAPQTWPAHLRITPGESRLDYRLRTMQTGYIPNGAAGLNGAKARYVEIVTPHLSRQVIETVRSLPAGLRRYSRAFSRIADGNARSIPHARSSSTPSMSDTLRSPQMLGAIVSALTSPEIELVLPGDGALYLLAALVAPHGGRPPAKAVLTSTERSILAALPPSLAYRVMPPWKGPEALPAARLGLRALLAGRTLRLLEEDADALRQPGKPGR